MWKKTNGDRNYSKQHKYVEFLLFWSQFSSSVGGLLAELPHNLFERQLGQSREGGIKKQVLATFGPTGRALVRWNMGLVIEPSKGVGTKAVSRPTDPIFG